MEVGFLPPANFLGEQWGTNMGLDFMSSSTRGADWEKWSLVDVVRNLGLAVLYVMAWFARILLVFLPQRTPLYGLTSVLEHFSLSCSSNHDHTSSASSGLTVSELDDMEVLTSGAIGRALLQVLALVNDLPASSGKYLFVRALAERIVQENTAYGHGYESVNRAALSAGFKRTLIMLNWSLEGINQQRRGSGDWWSLPMKMLRMLPMIPTAGFKLVLPPPLAFLKTQIGYFLPSLSTSTSMASIDFPGQLLCSSNVGNTETAEKLAQELLWLAEQLAETSALDLAVRQWSSSSSLASISLASSPRVQRALVRLSALFAKELVTGNADMARDVKFRMLQLWLPLFCTATHGVDGPIFNVSERMDVENTLEMVIKALPDSDQEVILSIWLQEFALSSSDWPNLQPCYDGWCNTTRKLGGHRRSSGTS